MTALQLLTQIREVGGRVWLEGFTIRYRLPRKHKRYLLAELRAHKSAVSQHLLELELKKVYIPVPCSCGEKAFPHFRHDTPVIPRGAVLIKGNLQELSTALAEMQGLYGNNWKMCALLRGLEQSRKERK